MSIDAVMDHAGLTRGGFYRHFRDKSQLYAEAVRWFRDHGFPQADRQPLRGNRDAGDLDLAPGVVVEVKAHKLPTGHPTIEEKGGPVKPRRI